MVDLSKASDDELKAEMARRGDSLEPQRPRVLDVPDFTSLINCCEEYMKALESKGWADEGFPYYIYESAIQAVYGDEVWGWINSR